jgi:hypothetical protein
MKKVPLNSEREEMRKTHIYEKEEVRKPPSSQRVEGGQKSFRERDKERDRERDKERDRERDRERQRPREETLDIEKKISVRKSKRESRPK